MEILIELKEREDNFQRHGCEIIMHGGLNKYVHI